MFCTGCRPGPREPRAAGISALLRDTRGQDLIEYALLSALVGIVALAALKVLGVTLGDVYSAWNTAVNALWESPAH